MRIAALLLAVALAAPDPALAWGDDGHRVIALLAKALLAPDIRQRVHSLLATDEDPLTDHDIAAEATWADHVRDANADGARTRTRHWHFVDVKRNAPVLARACFDHPSLPPGRPASLGPARACLIDKIDQFAAELADPAVAPDERLLALKFLLHFIGDVHQPLHAADDSDRGGNDKRVIATDLPATSLHHLWDTELVRTLGPDPASIAASLLRELTPSLARRWSSGTPETWAMESFAIADREIYGRLPEPNRSGVYVLGNSETAAAKRTCRLQLMKAGVRLAATLTRALARVAPRRDVSASPK